MSDPKELENLSTLELLELIKQRKDPTMESLSKSAFHVFTFRFSKDLIRKCEIICKKWGLDKYAALEVSQRTFNRFWKYTSFDISKKKENEIDKAVIYYLYGIAQRQLTDYYNQKNEIKISPYDGTETIIIDFPNTDDNFDIDEFKNPQSHYQAVRKALSNLSEKHKVIFLTYKAYEYDGNKLPRKLLESLRSNLNLSQATIRSYKKETYDKINEYLDIYGIK